MKLKIEKKMGNREWILIRGCTYFLDTLKTMNRFWLYISHTFMSGGQSSWKLKHLGCSFTVTPYTWSIYEILINQRNRSNVVSVVSKLFSHRIVHICCLFIAVICSTSLNVIFLSFC